MHDTRSLIDTRRYQTNRGQINSNYRAQKPHTERETDHLKMNNNDSGNNQNARFFQIGGKLRYHWSAEDEIMVIMTRREKYFVVGHETYRLGESRPNATTIDLKLGQRDLHTKKTGRRRKEGN